MEGFDFIDLFAGIGGIRIPFEEIGGKCVMSSEWDKFSQETYQINHGDKPKGDISLIPSNEIPNHDGLLGGFPCQPFSTAGYEKGFSDTRGTLFFDIQRILVDKRPKFFLLENVKGLKSHNKGKTLKSIVDILTGKDFLTNEELEKLDINEDARNALSTRLNYHVEYKVLRACDFGIPQLRERIYIVGFDKDQVKNYDKFKWPEPTGIETRVGDILEENVDEKYTLTELAWKGLLRRKASYEAKGSRFGYSLFTKESKYIGTIKARYWKDGNEALLDQSDIGKLPRKFTPRECARLLGFPDSFKIEVSNIQAYKQFGNSVAVPVIRAISKQIWEVLKWKE